jgi:recombination protein RecA
VVSKSGSWYSYKDTRIGQGRPNAISFMKENENIKKEIEKEVLELRGLAYTEKIEKKDE